MTRMCHLTHLIFYRAGALATRISNWRSLSSPSLPFFNIFQTCPMPTSFKFLFLDQARLLEFTFTFSPTFSVCFPLFFFHICPTFYSSGVSFGGLCCLLFLQHKVCSCSARPLRSWIFSCQGYARMSHVRENWLQASLKEPRRPSPVSGVTRLLSIMRSWESRRPSDLPWNLKKLPRKASKWEMEKLAGSFYCTRRSSYFSKADLEVRRVSWKFHCIIWFSWLFSWISVFHRTSIFPGRSSILICIAKEAVSLCPIEGLFKVLRVMHLYSFDGQTVDQCKHAGWGLWKCCNGYSFFGLHSLWVGQNLESVQCFVVTS